MIRTLNGQSMSKTIHMILLMCILFKGSIYAQVQVGNTLNDEAYWDAWLVDKMAEYQVPGAVFTFVKNGEIVLSKGYGVTDLETNTPIDPTETLFHLGSIAKIMTAMTVLQMVEEGTLTLDRDIANYFFSDAIQTCLIIRLLTPRANI